MTQNESTPTETSDEEITTAQTVKTLVVIAAVTSAYCIGTAIAMNRIERYLLDRSVKAEFRKEYAAAAVEHHINSEI